MSQDKEDYLLVQTLRVNALYNNAAIPVITMLCGATGLAITFWNETNSSALISWYFMIIAITALRCFIVFKYHRSANNHEEYDFWLSLYFAGTLLSGIVWGSTTYLLPVKNNIIELGLITMFILVVISGSIGIYSVFKRVYYALCVPTILPLIFFLFIQENKQLNQLCLITSLFTIFIFIVHYHAHKITHQLLLLKMDNKILLDHHESDLDKISILKKLNKTRTKQLEKIQFQLDVLKNKHA